MASREKAHHEHAGHDGLDPWGRFVDQLSRPAKPPRKHPVRLVCFDLDGVLIEAKSSWVAVNEAFGVNNEPSLHAFLRGEISEEEFIRRDVALWKAKDPQVSLGDIDRILSGVVLHAGAKDLLRSLHEAGIATAVVSGGLSNAAWRVARELGIRHVAANELVALDDGRLSGEGIVHTPLRDKSVPVRRFAIELGVPASQIASVGNSSPDIPMFWCSGLGIAFDPMDEHTRREADVVVEGKNLRRLLPVLLPNPQ